MLLAILVSSEEFDKESVDVCRVNGGTASVAVVDAIDIVSSSPATDTAEGDLTPAFLGVMGVFFLRLLASPIDPVWYYRLPGCGEMAFRFSSVSSGLIQVDAQRIYPAITCQLSAPILADADDYLRI